MARPDGVVIVSERFWAFAGKDGSLREGAMPSPPEAVSTGCRGPGLVRLGLSLSPFRRAGVAGRGQKPLLAAALIAPVSPLSAPGPAAHADRPRRDDRARRLDAPRPHASAARRRASRDRRRRGAQAARHLEGAAKPSRFSPRCGTNFAALALPLPGSRIGSGRSRRSSGRRSSSRASRWRRRWRSGGSSRPGSSASCSSGSGAPAADDPRARARGHARRAARSGLGSR